MGAVTRAYARVLRGGAAITWVGEVGSRAYGAADVSSGAGFWKGRNPKGLVLPRGGETVARMHAGVIGKWGRGGADRGKGSANRRPGERGAVATGQFPRYGSTQPV